MGADELAELRREIRRTAGGVRTIEPDGAVEPRGSAEPAKPRRYRVLCPRAVVEARVAVDEHGLITELLLEPVLDDRSRPAGQRLREQLPLAVALGILLLLALMAADAVLAESRAGMLAALLGVPAVAVISWFSVPWSWVSQYARLVVVGAALVLAAVGLARLPGLPVGRIDWVQLAFAGLTWPAAAATVRGLREVPGDRAPLLIANPLPGSRALIGQGGGGSVNHHAGHPVQRYALDLLCLNRFGARARGPAPRRWAAYRAYGATVAAPCAGTVLAVLDGQADQPVLASPFEPGPMLRQHVYGNHLLLRTEAAEDVVLVLAHLRAGSLRVAVGERVVVGQPLAEVGNSGNTTEPHLHLHAAARTGGELVPVPVRLVDHPGRTLWRGRRLDR
ncbi:M23 family metallopeptidase [Kitasatospora sp. NPDC008050]|uniref:M23 family metallopeptidase n=1 Tax=Kitasatospora sp. NPDC008050 TaxID=3364021 RepID=UPI0036E5B2F1